MSLDESTAGEADFDLNSAAEELLGDEAPEAEFDVESEESVEDASEEEVDESGQSEEEPEKEEVEEVTPESILEKFGKVKENPKADEEFVKGLNALGATRDGLPIQIKDRAHAKELIQKGFDYTLKTMELAQERRQREQEFQQVAARIQEKEANLQKSIQSNQTSLQAWQNMSAVLQEIAQTEPEIFNLIDQKYRSYEQQTKAFDPILSVYNSRFDKIEKMLSEREQKGQQAEHVQIREQWQNESKAIQDKFGASLNQMGIAVNWKQVQQRWMSDASGKMTVQQAFNAEYGDAIMKHHEESKKLLSIKNKGLQRKVSRPAAASRSTGSLPKRRALGDYNGILNDAAADLL